ncbi:ATP-binding protein [Sphaerisporangium sp. NPDC049002]|uniref:ATP-binding protein n=1 Tax=Sphaerisporangium sp. NPDC049002 TaxID=3155392 RepID=UPI0033DFF798
MRTAGLLGSIDLPGTPASASSARAYVRELLGAAGWREVDEVELLVSELFANAARHSDSGRRESGVVRVVVTHTGHALRVEVIDEGSSDHTPRVQQANADGEGGRGLWLVDQIASSWGVREAPAGRAVWFEIATVSSGAGHTGVARPERA